MEDHNHMNMDHPHHHGNHMSQSEMFRDHQNHQMNDTLDTNVSLFMDYYSFLHFLFTAVFVF